VEIIVVGYGDTGQIHDAEQSLAETDLASLSLIRTISRVLATKVDFGEPDGLMVGCSFVSAPSLLNVCDS
jgi:hypothetical protein